MSVTVVNDWSFHEGADLDEGMDAIREYIRYLAETEPELQQSLWLRIGDAPLRYFHIATYARMDALDRQRSSDGTRRFVGRLYPLIDRESLAQPVGVVIANHGTGPGEV